MSNSAKRRTSAGSTTRITNTAAAKLPTIIPIADAESPIEWP
jgi:hypothetical protein